MKDHIIGTYDEKFTDIDDDLDLATVEAHELIIALAQGGFFNVAGRTDKDIIATHKQLLDYYRSLEK